MGGLFSDFEAVRTESRDHDAHAVVPRRSCLEAYKKMNNVLIDDSRIRVDFSQSVAKIWSRYTMQYKGSAAAKLREKHRKGGSKLDVGHYGPGGGSSQRAYGGRSGEDGALVVDGRTGRIIANSYRVSSLGSGERGASGASTEQRGGDGEERAHPP